MAYAKFAFHYDASFSTNTVFERDAVTVNPLGEECVEDRPRFDSVVMIPSIATPDPVFSPADTRGIVLASGVAANGTTELMLWYRQPSSGAWGLYVFSGSLPGSLPGSPTRTLTLRTRTLPYGHGGTTGTGDTSTSFYDLFTDAEHGTAIPTLKDRWLAFEPMDACIFHGAIVLAGQVYLASNTSNNSFVMRGWGFAISTDSGANWKYLGGDVNDTSAITSDMEGWPRGAQYCFRAAPIFTSRTSAHPTSCYFSSTDYRQSPGGATYSGARSARVFMFKLVRPSGSSSSWAPPSGLQNPEVIFWTITDSLTHTHSCQITEYVPSIEGPDGLQLITSIGDAPACNRFWRVIMEDTSDDYTVTANWQSPVDEYHGRHFHTASSDPPGDDPGTLSSQPAAVCFGHEPGKIIWGTDTTHDVIVQMNAPMTSAGATFSHLYGVPHCAGNRITGQENRITPILGTIRDPRPELAGLQGSPAVAILIDGTETPSRIDFTRLLYTPRVGPYSASSTEDATTWTQAAIVRTPWAFAIIFDGDIYLSSSQGSYGLKRIPVPDVRVFRPLLLGPGGANLAVEDCSYLGTFYQSGDPVDSSVDVDRLTQVVPGEYTDPSSNTIYLPVPPCIGAAVFRVRTSRYASGPTGRKATVGNFKLSANSTITGMAWATNPSPGVFPVRRWRTWVIDGTLGEISPNKTTFSELSQLESPEVNAQAIYSCSDRWCPAHAIARRTLASGSTYAFPLDMIGGSLGGDSPDDNCFYVIVDGALDGNGSIGYPLAPNASGPDERLTLEDLNLIAKPLGDAGWRMRVVGMHPIGSWDHFSERSDAGDASLDDRRWSLFHVWADDDNWIEIRARCQSKCYELRICDGGTISSHSFGDEEDQYWYPDAPLLVAIGYWDEESSVVVGLSLGGDQLRVLSVEAFANETVFTEVRFRDAETDEVVEFRWVGGDYDDGSPPDNSWLPTAFANLGFLDS